MANNGSYKDVDVDALAFKIAAGATLTPQERLAALYNPKVCQVQPMEVAEARKHRLGYMVPPKSIMNTPIDCGHRPVQHVYTTTPKKYLVNTDKGLALQGYDPVAYFLSRKAVLGDHTITATHEGAVYNFSTKRNRDFFVKYPPRYAPAFGGYCGYALGAANMLAPIDPKVWTIIDGRLVLQHSQEAFGEWNKDPKGTMAKANANWPLQMAAAGKVATPKVLVNAENGLAIQGYDPVAYFIAHKAIKGNAAFTATHEGAVYQFSSAQNRELFARSPYTYAPAFGGYCGYALGELNVLAPIDPTEFVMINGNLVLQHNAAAKAKWAKDPKGFMAKAEANWPGQVVLNGI